MQKCMCNCLTYTVSYFGTARGGIKKFIFRKVLPVSFIVSEQKPSHSVQGKLSEMELSQGTNLGQLYQKKLHKHQKFPGSQWAPSLWNRRSLEPARLFLELTAQPNSVARHEGPRSVRWPVEPCRKQPQTGANIHLSAWQQPRAQPGQRWIGIGTSFTMSEWASQSPDCNRIDCNPTL